MKPTQFNILNSATRDGGLRSGLSRHWLAAALGLAVLLAGTAPLRAGNLYIPNYSFEVPNIGTDAPYGAPVLSSWAESPQPGWYDPAEFGAPWSEFAGTFYNVPFPGEYIDNCDGVQAAYLYVFPQAGISQVLSATFNPGKAYTLTVGLIGAGGDMPIGSTFQLSLYYLDASGGMITVAATTVTNTAANFPDRTNLVDFQVKVPGVNASDPWAGQNIGIQLLATPDPGNPDAWVGYWDADNVRLVEQIYVPNYSFEVPNIGTDAPYGAPVLSSWAESPQPGWYDPAEFGAPWSEFAGTFYNVPFPGEYIDNCDGVQAAYLYVFPQAGISQVLSATFNPGKAYTLTVGLIGAGGDMPIGSTFQLSLYYLDAFGGMITVAATTVTNTAANFPDRTNLVDFQVKVPGVNASDPWAGQNIGIQLLATPDPGNPDAWVGYWDADNVRLVETTALNLVNPTMNGGLTQLTVLSEPGVLFQILATTNLSLPVTDWTRLGTLTNVTGSMPFVDSTTGPGQGFYTAKTSP